MEFFCCNDFVEGKTEGLAIVDVQFRFCHDVAYNLTCLGLSVLPLQALYMNILVECQACCSSCKPQGHWP